MIKSIKKFFQLLNRSLDGAYNLADEAICWSEELIAESKKARDDLKKEREAE